jgi:cysteine desulfurase
MIYLDHNATTPLDSEVFEAMRPYFLEHWGNPSSTYHFGSETKAALEMARSAVAVLLNAPSQRDLIFTAGATEANNAAIQAALRANLSKRHIITSAVEHSAVLAPCRDLESNHGYSVTYLPVNREGLLSLTDLENALEENANNTALVSLMWANNETGVLFPVHRIAEICRARGVSYHCDAVQAVGKLPTVDVRRAPVDYLSLSGHKFHGPKGVGALYIRRDAPWTPLLHGGHQERGRRGGTENVPLIVGLGKAAERAKQQVTSYGDGVSRLREKLEAGLLASVMGAERNGDPNERLPNTANFTFPGVESEALLLLLDQEGICASSGSACLADSPDPSHVLAAMKPDEESAHQSIRFSLNTTNTDKEIIATVEAVRNSCNLLRN